MYLQHEKICVQMKQETSRGSIFLHRFSYKKPTIPFDIGVQVFGLHYGVAQSRKALVAVLVVEHAVIAIKHSVHLYHLITETAKMTENLSWAFSRSSCPALCNNIITGVWMQYPTRSRASHSLWLLFWGAFGTFRSCNF